MSDYIETHSYLRVFEYTESQWAIGPFPELKPSEISTNQSSLGEVDTVSQDQVVCSLLVNAKKSAGVLTMVPWFYSKSTVAGRSDCGECSPKSRFESAAGPGIPGCE